MIRHYMVSAVRKYRRFKNVVRQIGKKKKRKENRFIIQKIIWQINQVIVISLWGNDVMLS